MQLRKSFPVDRRAEMINLFLAALVVCGSTDGKTSWTGPVTTTMCESRSQTVTVHTESTGFIQSPGYPDTPPDTGDACTVNLVVNNPVSVEIKVNGMFAIPSTRAPDCSHYDRQFWIGERILKNTFCGPFDDRTELCTIENSTVLENSTISFGFQFNTWENPNTIAYFRIMYTVRLLLTTPEPPGALTTYRTSSAVQSSEGTSVHTTTPQTTATHKNSSTVSSTIPTSSSYISEITTDDSIGTAPGGNFATVPITIVSCGVAVFVAVAAIVLILIIKQCKRANSQTEQRMNQKIQVYESAQPSQQGEDDHVDNTIQNKEDTYYNISLRHHPGDGNQTEQAYESTQPSQQREEDHVYNTIQNKNDDTNYYNL